MFTDADRAVRHRLACTTTRASPATRTTAATRRTPGWTTPAGPPRTSVPAHELTHTLGGVLGTAPHATKNGHCYDDADLMCYDDGSGVTDAEGVRLGAGAAARLQPRRLLQHPTRPPAPSSPRTGTPPAPASSTPCVVDLAAADRLRDLVGDRRADRRPRHLHGSSPQTVSWAWSTSATPHRARSPRPPPPPARLPRRGGRRRRRHRDRHAGRGRRHRLRRRDGRPDQGRRPHGDPHRPGRRRRRRHRPGRRHAGRQGPVRLCLVGVALHRARPGRGHVARLRGRHRRAGRPRRGRGHPGRRPDRSAFTATLHLDAGGTRARPPRSAPSGAPRRCGRGDGLGAPHRVRHPCSPARAVTLQARWFRTSSWVDLRQLTTDANGAGPHRHWRTTGPARSGSPRRRQRPPGRAVDPGLVKVGTRPTPASRRGGGSRAS